MNAELELLSKETKGRSSTSSTKLHQPGDDRFFVLRDSPVDGNQFLPDVAEAGASAVIASDPTRAMNSPSDLALLQVQDTLTALHKLAPSYRQLMPQRPESFPIPISRGTATSRFRVLDYPALQPVAPRRNQAASLSECSVRLGLILVVVVAIAIRLAYVVTLDRTRLTWHDEVSYDQIGWQLAKTGQFQSSAYGAAPVLPTFLAIVYRVFGHSYCAARICQVLLSAIFVLAMFWLADVFFGRKAAYLTALGTAFYPPFIYLSVVLYAEHTYLLLMAVTLCSLARWQQQRRASWLVVAGIFMGLTALCRPVFLGFFPFAAAYVWWRAPKKTGMRCSLAVCAVAVATISPWTIRNAVVFKRFVPVASGVGIQLWCGNNDLSLGNTDDTVLRPLNQFWKERAQTLLTDGQRAELTARMESFVGGVTVLDEVSGDRRLASEALRWLKAHPEKFLVLSCQRVLMLYSAFSKMHTKADAVNRRSAVVAALSFYPVLTLGLVGMALAAYRNKASLLLHAVIGANLLTYAPMLAVTRFRLPIDAYWIAFAAFAVVVMWDRLTHTFWRHKPAPPADADWASLIELRM